MRLYFIFYITVPNTTEQTHMNALLTLVTNQKIPTAIQLSCLFNQKTATVLHSPGKRELKTMG